MGINRLVYTLFAVSVVILAWLGNVYMIQNRSQLKYTAEVEHTYKVIITLNSCENLLLDAETKQRGYILTKDNHFKDAAQVSISRIDSVVRRLKEFTADNSNQRVNIHLLELSIAQRLVILNQNLYVDSDEKVRSEKLAVGRLAMEKIHVYIQAIAGEENALLIERSNAKNHYQSLNFTFVKYMFLFACLVCTVAVLLIILELKKRIRAQKMLEKSILDLKRSNEEVEQITYTASHDLQEPLRKIRTLSTLLIKQNEQRLSEADKDILDRIDRATGKMHSLINDLVDFATLLNVSEKQEPVNLAHVFDEAFEKAANGAHINRYDLLPVIKGSRPQLMILFVQLLDNAVTYKDPNRPLVINVTYRITAAKNTRELQKKSRAAKYHQVTISDNGIGFDNSFSEKIFVLFQRLHNREEYSGKGTGLALVKRIMTNHYGYAEAHGEKGIGASFSLYFPVD